MKEFMVKADTKDDKVLIGTSEGGLTLTSVLNITPGVATLLAAGHAKDKLGKLQKKTSLVLNHKLSPSEEKSFDSVLVVFVPKEVTLDILAEGVNAIRKVHQLLIQSAILPTIIGNVLADMKPLENDE